MSSRVSWFVAFMSAYKKRVIAAGGYIEGEQCAIDKVKSDTILKNASWRLIPEGIKEDVVYAQKPTDGLGDLQFTRASDATRTNSAGVIERTPWNLISNSEMFSAWTMQNGSIGVNVALSPIGTLTADKLIPDATTAQHRILQSINFTGPGVFSVYAKADGYNFLSFGVAGGAGGGSIFFNVSNGTISGSASGFTPLIENVGNGWYRCSVQKADLGAGIGLSYIIIARQAATTADYAGNGTSGVLIWGAQLVEGTDAKPYFATTNRQDVPRLDYRNADGTVSTCPRLLLEPQRTNLIANSTMVGAAAGSPGTAPTTWTFNGGGGLTRTISIGIENGLQYIDFRFQGVATQTFLTILPSNASYASSTGQVYTFTGYVKLVAGSIPNLRLVQLDNASNSYITTINPTATLLRYTQTTPALPVGNTNIRPYFDTASLAIGATYDFTIRIAAPQMELGAYATTFIPTTTAAVTRLADAASKTGVSSLIGQTEGTLFLDFEGGANDSTEYIFGVNDGTTNNRILIYRGNNNRIVSQVRFGGTIQALISTLTVTPDTRHKCAVAYKANDVAFYVNGVQVGVDTLASIPSCSVISMDAGVGGVPFYRPVNQAALFPTRLTNARLQELTTL